MVNAKLAIAALAGLVSAAPAVEQRDNGPEKGTLVVHNYEDAPRLPLVPITEAGEYKDLHYEGFVYVDAGLDGTLIAGVEPSSPSVVVASSDVSKDLSAGVSRIDVKGTTTENFDFKSFNFGCVVNPVAVAVASVPVSCKVTVTGYGLDNKITATQEFRFGARGIKDPMVYVELSDDFEDLTAVEFTASSLANDLVSALFDDMTFRLYDDN